MKDHNGNSSSELTEGTKVGKYLLVNKIGSGGMGDVYLAEDTDLNRKVALKFLSSSIASDIDCKARFIREAQAAAKLNHPNIVTIYEVSEFKGRPFFAMEYVEGDSLRDISEKQDLTQAQVIDIAIQICDGLQEAHAAGIIHRDIKPSNILVDQNNRCKLLDFGLAVVRGCDPLTKDKSTLGTVSYMSPEQILGKEIDSRADIFSFGIVLYELLSGDLPFNGEHDAGMMYSIVNSDPIPLQNIMQDASPELDSLINRLLQKSPDDRFQSMADVAIELRRIKGDTSAPSRLSASSSTSSRRSVIRKKILGIIIPLIVIGIAALSYFIFAFNPSKSSLKRVVVVPFQNQTGDASLDPFGRMIADWISQGLIQTRLTEVVSPEITLGPDVNEDIRSIAGKSGSNAVVAGSFYRIADKILVQAKIMDSNNKLLQAIEPIATPAEKMMDAVEAIRKSVTGAFTFEFSERSKDIKAIEIKPPSYEAYQQYFSGIDIFIKSAGTEGLEFFDRAYTLDTLFVSALLYSFSVYQNLGLRTKADSVIQFLNARRSHLNSFQQLLLDEGINVLSGDHVKALIIARELAEISPTDLFIYGWGRQAYFANHPREAIKAFKRIDLESYSMHCWIPYWNFLTASYHTLGDYENEIQASQMSRKLYPNDISTLSDEMRAFAAMGKFDGVRECLTIYATLLKQDNADLVEFMRTAAEELRAHGYEDSSMAIFNQAILCFESLPSENMKTRRLSYGTLLYEARRWKEARGVFEELESRLMDSLDLRGAWLGTSAARLGDGEKARKVSRWLDNIKRPFLYGAPTYNQACIAAILGEREKAVELLNESLLQGYSYFDVHIDMDFESLRDYPPFKNLMSPKD